MKALFLSIILLFVLFQIKAEIIPISIANNIAKKAYQTHCQNNVQNPEILSSITIRDSKNQEVMYAFNFIQGGFILLSAESNAKPLLAFSNQGSFSIFQELSNVQQWVENYKNEIIAIREANLSQNSNLIQEWNFYKNQNSLYQLGGGSVSPLLTTLWSQGCYYNDSTPTDSSGSCFHPVSGCVATAMAQVMKYYNFPPNGSGSHSYVSNYGPLTANFANTSYNWLLMPNSLNSSSTSAEIAQVAQLMSHCGISVDMQYSAGASGAYSVDAKDALIHYFNYSKDIKYLDRANYTDSIWEMMLRNQLDSSRVVYYSGSGSGAHAFVCDGYQNGNYFHFNWGWSGSLNGYFTVGNLNPGGMNFSNYSSAIFGIKPDTIVPCQTLKILTSNQGSFSDGSVSNDYTASNDCSWLIQPIGGVDISLEFYTFSLANGDTVKVFDGNSTNAPLLGTFTGNNLPTIITSSGTEMLIKFTSDAQNQGGGFSASYLANYCKGYSILTQPTDTFDDGSGSELYRDNTTCSWLIQPQNASSIQLEFLDFNTESGYDYVKVYDGINSSANMLGSWSGNNLPAAVSSTSGSMYIEFIVDGGVIDQGWKAKYTACISTSAPIVSNTSFCENDSVLLSTNLPIGTFTWLYNNQATGNTSQSFYTSMDGSYSLIASPIGCPTDTSTSVNIIKNPLPVINLGNDTVFGCLLPIPYYYSAPVGNYSYLWHNGSTISSYLIDTNLSIGLNVIWCKITDINGCSNTDTVNILLSLGMNDFDENSIIKIFPNPSNRHFTVSSSIPMDGNLRIFSLQGELIFQQKTDSNTELKINLPNIESGTYIIQFVQASKVVNKRIIIN